MTVTSIPQRSARPIRHAAATHLFQMGQVVRLKKGFAITVSKFTDTYRITGMLPPRGNVLQYRIRSDNERHERVATEDSLEPVPVPSAGEGSTLLEKTFGHDQWAV
jgi:hypothetical protein